MHQNREDLGDVRDDTGGCRLWRTPGAKIKGSLLCVSVREQPADVIMAPRRGWVTARRRAPAFAVDDGESAVDHQRSVQNHSDAVVQDVGKLDLALLGTFEPGGSSKVLSRAQWSRGRRTLPRASHEGSTNWAAEDGQNLAAADALQKL